MGSLEDQSYRKPPSQASDSCKKSSFSLEPSQEGTVFSVRNSSCLGPEQRKSDLDRLRVTQRIRHRDRVWRSQQGHLWSTDEPKPRLPSNTASSYPGHSISSSPCLWELPVDSCGGCAKGEAREINKS